MKHQFCFKELLSVKVQERREKLLFHSSAILTSLLFVVLVLH